MRRTVAGLACLALPLLSACATSLDASDSLFVEPGKYNYLRCRDLVDRTKASAARERELTSLMERAGQGTGGMVVNTMVYSADLQQVRADLRLLRQTAAEKNCDKAPASEAEPPPAPATPAAPSASRRSR